MHRSDTVRLAYTTEIYSPTIPEAAKSKIKLPSGLVAGGNSLPGLQKNTFLLYVRLLS